MQTKQGEEERWQNVAESLADPFVSPFEKPALLLKLVQRAPQVTRTLADVTQGKAEPEQLLGDRGQQQLRGARAVSRQLTEDILPDALPEVQRLFGELSKGPSSANSQAGDVASTVSSGLVKLLDDLTADGKLPSPPSPADIAAEVKQIFESTPQDLETPAYTVLERTSEFEIREYAAMTVASLEMVGNSRLTNVSSPENTNANPNGNAFQTLAAFLFGDNSKREPMAMTTPVITKTNTTGNSQEMSFVIPSKFSAGGGVPQPKNGSLIRIQDVPACKVGVREFPGFATNQEIVRNRLQLIGALRIQGWDCKNASEADVQVMQYNSPITLPTIRRNEVLVKLDDLWTPPPSARSHVTADIIADMSNADTTAEVADDVAADKQAPVKEEEETTAVDVEVV